LSTKTNKPLLIISIFKLNSTLAWKLNSKSRNNSNISPKWNLFWHNSVPPFIINLVVASVQGGTIMAKNKHLTTEERRRIADCLKDNMSFKSIGNEMGKDCTTISKEVKKHSSIAKTGCMGKAHNNCKHRFVCKEARLCDTCIH
jgi:hypothetical protein